MKELAGIAWAPRFAARVPLTIQFLESSMNHRQQSEDWLAFSVLSTVGMEV